jgi:hypothetical protein
MVSLVKVATVTVTVTAVGATGRIDRLASEAFATVSDPVRQGG